MFRGSRRHGLLVAGLAIIVGLIGYSVMEPETRSFDAAQWKAYRGSLADDSPRPAMAAQVKALLERRTPTRKDVVALLGRPDEQTPEALYYVLGRSDLSVSFDYLGIYFDPDQRVSRVVRTHR